MPTNFTYLLLNLILILTFIGSGYLISKDKRHYWKYAIWCIIAFSIIQGCRYARGNDYLAYSNFFKIGVHEENPFFAYINHLLKNIGFNQYSCFIAYAFTFVTCAIIFFKNYKKYAIYLFPLFIIGYMRFEEYMIRQAFSYSFFFLYMKYLFQIKLNGLNSLKKLILNKNTIYCILCALLIVSIHTANIINIFVITFLYITFPKPFSPIISIPTYIICVYVIPQHFDFSFLQPILNFAAEQNQHAASYVENSDIWFSTTGYNKIYEKNVFTELFQVIGSSSLMYLGYRLIKEKFESNRMLCTLLNTFIIGLCIESSFYALEILNRIGYVLDLTGFLLLGFVLYHRPPKPSAFRNICYISLSWFLYYYFKDLIFPAKTLFIWDTNYPLF